MPSSASFQYDIEPEGRTSLISALNIPAFVPQKPFRARNPLSRKTIVRKEHVAATAKRTAIPFATPEHVRSSYPEEFEEKYYFTNERPDHHVAMKMQSSLALAKEQLAALTVLPAHPDERQAFSKKRYQLSRIIIDYTAMMSNIRCLPVEVLEIIFCYLRDNWSHVNLFVPTTPLTRVARVCRQWSNIIASSPNLYHVLNVDANRIHHPLLRSIAVPMLQRWLACSNRKLCISFTCSDKAHLQVAARLLDVILDRSQDWQFIHLDVTAKQFPKLERIRDRLPKLERLLLTVPVGKKPLCDFFKNAPLLKDVDIKGSFPGHLPNYLALPWNQLVCFKFRGREGFDIRPVPPIGPKDALVYMQQCTNATSLSLHVRFPKDSPLLPEGSDDTKKKPYRLPLVRRLLLWGDLGYAATLEVLSLPGLEELSLSQGGSARGQRNLLDFLRRCKCDLKSLHLGGDLADKAFLSQILELTPNLTSLDIRTTSLVALNLVPLFDPQVSLGNCLVPRLKVLSWDFVQEHYATTDAPFIAMLKARTVDHALNDVSHLQALNLRIGQRDANLSEKILQWRETFKLEVELRLNWQIKRVERDDPEEPVDKPVVSAFREEFNPDQ